MPKINGECTGAVYAVKTVTLTQVKAIDLADVKDALDSGLLYATPADDDFIKLECADDVLKAFHGGTLYLLGGDY